MKPRTRFGETTFDNCVTFMVDGEENFRLKYQKINEARNSIYIANYDNNYNYYHHIIRLTVASIMCDYRSPSPDLVDFNVIE